MKNLNKYIVILMLLTSTNFWAQIDPASTIINSPMKADPINTSVSTIRDTIFRDLTSMRDSVALYPKNISRAGSNDSVRLVYFLHGIGGNNGSWNGVYSYHKSIYRLDPFKPEYSGNQHSFDNASLETRQDMERDFGAYRTLHNDSFDLVEKPYIIAHSLGGLVARDMDMKYNTPPPLGALFDSSKRRFHGLVTFGTPHAGALIAGNQDKINRMGAGFASKMLAATAEQSLVNITSKSWVARMLAGSSSTSIKVRDIAAQLGNSTSLNVMKLFNQQDGISKQFTPTSTYLKDTLSTYSNPHLAKALFYGEEEDPILWRIALFMVKPASEFPTFGANDDDEYKIMIEDLANKFTNKSIALRNNANWHMSKSRNYWNLLGGLGLYYYQYRMHINRYLVLAYASQNSKELADYIYGMNLQYKVIIGAVDAGNMYRTDTVSWKCIRTIVSIRHPRDGGGVQTSQTVKHITNPALCNTSSSSTGGGVIADYTVLVPVTRQVLIEIPSDATVTRASARAFPGCNNQYKNLMGPVPLPGGGMSKGKVNHLQMRNCYETKDALEKIYKGDGVTIPTFFKLHKW